MEQLNTVLSGNILRPRNILSAFDRFVGNEILSEIDFQDDTGTYHDVHEEIKSKPGDKASIMDDVFFACAVSFRGATFFYSY